MREWSSVWPYLVAALFIIGPLFYGWCDRDDSYRFRGLRGMDGRLSTSKLAAFAWSLALAGAAVILLLRVAGDKVTLTSSRLADLDPIYLLLIGSPLFALIVGKGIVESKVNTGQLQKPRPGAAVGRGDGGLLKDDQGKIDLLDLQYVLFNLVLMVYFVAEVLKKSQVPELPPTLVGLTSSAAAAYVAGKAVASNPPTIASVTSDGKTPAVVTVRGQNLLAWTDHDLWKSKVSVAGREVTGVTNWDDTGTSVLFTTASPPTKGDAVAVTTAAGATIMATVD